MLLPKQSWTIILTSWILFLAPLSVNAESTWQMANRMLNCYFYPQAYVMFLRLAKEDPDNPEVHYDLARCLDWMGKQLRATKEFQIYLDLAPGGSHAKYCHDKINAWNQELAEKGEKYTLSNWDIWFEEHYKYAKYHSWDENPEADWVIKLEEKKKNDRKFGVDVHFICPHLSNLADDTKPERWHGLFMNDFRKNWEKSAKEANALGCADLYIRMLKDGHLEPIIVKCEGNDSFEKALLATFALYNNSQILQDACNKGYVIKAQIGASMKSPYTGSWSAFTIGGPVKAQLVTIDGTLNKHKKFTDLTTSSLILPNKAELKEDVPYKALKADDEEQIAGAQAAIDASKYTDAIDYLWPLGERDIPQACLLLGQIYSDKNHKQFDPRMAAIWWEKTAKLGEVTAQYKTGCIYEWCDGNYHGGMPDAVNWYQIGAKNGSAQCALKLGILSEFGDGMPCNQKTAIHWYKIAAGKEQKDAERALSRLHDDHKAE